MSIYIYTQKLITHDWWYNQSDDQRVWRKGQDTRMYLERMQMLYDRHFVLWNMYAPEEFQRNVKK